MRLSKAGEIACIVLFFVSAFWHQGADSRGQRQAAMGLGVLAVVGWFASSRLKGWIGLSYQEMKDELVKLEALAERWQRPDGSGLGASERERVLARRDKLYAAIEAHPDRPRREGWPH